MARKRIVINLDAPEGGPATSSRKSSGRTRRWPKVLAVLAGFVLVLLVIAAVGGFLWWRHYQSTPAYTLTLIIAAAQINDMTEFQKRIDDEEIAKNMLASVNQKAADRYGFALNSSIQGQIDKVMPSLLPQLKQTIHDEVVKEIKFFSMKPEADSFIFLVVNVPSRVKITTEGDIAKATTSISSRTLELTMRRDAERWKVTEVKSDFVVQQVVDSMMQKLPAIGTVDSNSPLFKKPSRAKRRRR